MTNRESDEELEQRYFDALGVYPREIAAALGIDREAMRAAMVAAIERGRPLSQADYRSLPLHPLAGMPGVCCD